jgi:TPR repeat protein
VACGLIACGRNADPVAEFDRGAYAASFATFSERAVAGDAAAQNYLGIHYYLGAGVERDFGRAAAWFEKAALARHAPAQRNLAILYLRGLGVAKDNVKAYGWFYEAFTHGDTKSQSYLALIATTITPNQIIEARSWIDDRLRQSPAGPR